VKQLESLATNFRAKARVYDLEATREDRVTWYAHPCTQILVNALHADAIEHMLLWLGTGYLKESAEATQAANARAVGISGALEDVLNKIEEIKSASEEVEDSPSGT
jgi:hypothetical protein